MMVNFFCRIIVATINQIHVFSFPSPAQRLLTIETRDNPHGLCEVTPITSAEKQLLVFPGHKVGSIQLVVSSRVVFKISLASQKVLYCEIDNTRTQKNQEYMCTINNPFFKRCLKIKFPCKHQLLF